MAVRDTGAGVLDGVYKVRDQQQEEAGMEFHSSGASDLAEDNSELCPSFWRHLGFRDGEIGQRERRAPSPSPSPCRRKKGEKGGVTFQKMSATHVPLNFFAILDGKHTCS